MPDVVKRGYMPSDDKEFIDQIEKLRELSYLFYHCLFRFRRTLKLSEKSP